MKKVVIGCLAVLLLTAIAGGVGMYYFIYRPAKAMIGSLSQLQEWPKVEDQVRNHDAFTPPGTGELTPAMVDRFVRTQQSIKDKLGARLEELDEKYKAMSQGDPDRTASFGEVMSALKDLGGLIMDAKRVQVEALNEHGFSVAEYEWVRRTVYAASGIPVQTDVGEIIRRAARGEVKSPESMLDAATGEVPEANRRLIEPYKQTLTDNAGLAFFGL